VTLDPILAATLARVALANVATAYPYKLDQVLTGDADLLLPRVLHPAFRGSYDWHSCVHMHWSLVRLVRRFPDRDFAAPLRVYLGTRLTPEAIEGELASLSHPHRASFERPYGWGWLLALAADLQMLAREQDRTRDWSDALGPLAQAFAARFVDFLPRADYPTRAGSHGNSAFALLLALRWCEVAHQSELRRLIAARAQAWYGADSSYPAAFEPSGDDFLAAGLVEAALMHRVLEASSFANWWKQFVPDERALAHWLRPVAISDACDAKIVHLHGVNLTRAWCWRQLLPELGTPLRTAAESAIATHLAASLPAASSGDYVGTHWLASFALLALDGL
jgi:hypothetical protein